LSTMIKYSISFLFLFIGFLSHAQQPDKQQQTNPGIFQNDVAIEAILTFDFKVFKKEWESELEIPATFEIVTEEGDSIEKSVKIKTRGGYRKAHCQYPPIRINFSKADFELPGWEDLRKVKLVRKCKSSSMYNQLIIREWLVYRMYNLFTDKGYKTCLLHLTMKDAQENKKPIESYAFLIEETDELAIRMNSKEVELKRVHPNQFDGVQMNTVSVFQYMIGNLDWSAPMMHNVKTFRPDGEGMQWHIPVPYDFDFSGIVNATYASPPPELGVETVRTRVFRGFCRPPDEYKEVFEIFRDRESDIFALIDNCQYLVKSSKKDMTNYVRQFYNILGNESQIQREIFDSCR